MDRAEAVREMTFEEEAVLYQQEAKAIFAKEDTSCEAPPINHTVRRGMRIIRKAREEIAALREQERKGVEIDTVKNEWIRVEERLPKSQADVLVVAFWHECWQTMIGWHSDSGERWRVITPHGEREPGGVTHWMPLPEPPKEGADHE